MRKELVGFALLALLSGACFAVVSEQEILDLKYPVAECYLNASVAVVDAVGVCAGKFNVTAADLSPRAAVHEADKAALKAMDSEKEFDDYWENAAKPHMEETRQAIADANNSLVGTNLSIGLARLCYFGELVKIQLNLTGCVVANGFGGFAKALVINIYDAMMARGDVILANAKAGGLDTQKMQEALDKGKSLRADLVDSLNRGDKSKFEKTRLEFGRAVDRFFAEYDGELAGWAEPRVQASENYNKAEILSIIANIKSETSQVNSRCPAVYDYADADSFEADNQACWQTLKNVEGEAKQVVALYVSGRPVYVGGNGSLHAQGDGNVSIFGSGQVNASGTGDLYVKDFKGDARVEVSGTGSKQPDGSTLYSGFGSAKVSGSLFFFKVSGTGLTVDANGNGLVKMIGRGSFNTQPGFSTEGSYNEQ